MPYFVSNTWAISYEVWITQMPFPHITSACRIVYFNRLVIPKIIMTEHYLKFQVNYRTFTTIGIFAFQLPSIECVPHCLAPSCEMLFKLIPIVHIWVNRSTIVRVPANPVFSMVVMSRRVVPAAGVLYWKRISESGVWDGRL